MFCFFVFLTFIGAQNVYRIKRCKIKVFILDSEIYCRFFSFYTPSGYLCWAKMKSKGNVSQAYIDTKLQEYLDKFSDRCLQELKLETMTLKDDPSNLYRSILVMAQRIKEGSVEENDTEKTRREAEEKRECGECCTSFLLFGDNPLREEHSTCCIFC